MTSLILGIYFYVDANRVNERMKTQTQQYTEVVPPQLLKSDDLDKLRSAKNDPTSGFAGKSLLEVAIAQRGQLASLISGSDDNATATGAATHAVANAKTAGAKPATDSLSAVVDALVTQVNSLKTEADNNKKDSDESKQKLSQTVAATQAQIESLTNTMEGLRQEKDAALQQVQQITQQQGASFASTAGDLRKQLQTAQDQINQVNSQNADLGAQVKKLNTELDKTRQKLNDIRVDPTKAVTQQVDGHIVRLSGSNLCFIDLGAGDQVTPGLTFEVYDKNEGVPPPGDPSTDENLPVGKASIEVIRVGPSSSECRITRLSTGAELNEGDLIVNLVYDKNTKYNFVVYGDFDLSQTGNATPKDADVIKRLITQWGGNVVGQINVDTDFVVLGKEPVIPDRPKEDDPIAKAKYDAAVAASEAYAEISSKARAYRIPILNQNRFLYLVGYYDQAKR
ncbi:MAG TPA: hypothetical protein VGF52_01150 [Tepidisphaeraceae bacterium]